MFENKTVVIKFGTSVLTQGSNLLSKPHMLDFVRQIKKLIDIYFMQKYNFSSENTS